MPNNYGMKVAKDGYTVSDSDEHMAFTSKYFSDTIRLVSSSVIAMAGSTGSVTVTHNLGYVPQVWAWKGTVPLPTNVIDTGGVLAGVAYTADIAVTSTTFTIYLNLLLGATYTGNIGFYVIMMNRQA